MSAGNDPLRDEGYKFVLRLLENGINVTCKEYINFPHGFMSFNIPMAGISECKEAITQAINYFKDFIYKDKDESERLTHSRRLVSYLQSKEEEDPIDVGKVDKTT